MFWEGSFPPPLNETLGVLISCYCGVPLLDDGMCQRKNNLGSFAPINQPAVAVDLLYKIHWHKVWSLQSMIENYSNNHPFSSQSQR